MTEIQALEEAISIVESRREDAAMQPGDEEPNELDEVVIILEKILKEKEERGKMNISIYDRIVRIDELLGSISYVVTNQGLRANQTWDEVARLLNGLREELKNESTNS